MAAQLNVGVMHASSVLQMVSDGLDFFDRAGSLSPREMECFTNVPDGEDVRELLKCIKGSAYDICDAVDEFHSSSQLRPMARNNLFANFPQSGSDAIMVRMLEAKVELMRCQIVHLQFYTGNEQLEAASCDDEKTRIIVGRDEEKQRIVDMLVSPGRTQPFEGDNMVIAFPMPIILPIFGRPGIGKTELARLVFRDTRFQDHLKAWVHVPQEYDLEKLGISIISELSKLADQYHIDSDNDNMDLIMKTLDDIVHSHLPKAGCVKVLLVLDGLSEFYDPWKQEQLQKMLNTILLGKQEWTVIITTCLQSIAYSMRVNTEPYKLHPLTDDMCWAIIKREAGAAANSQEQELVEKIGLEIAKSCRGLPLAAVGIGSLLRSIENPQEWPAQLRDSAAASQSMFSYMKQRYLCMPPRMRLCFAYCAIFPKGHNIAKRDLSYQWFLVGFIRSLWNREEQNYCAERISKLVDILFMQPTALASAGRKHDQNAALFTMPDPVHDFARSVLGDDLIIVDGRDGTSSVNDSARFALITDPDVMASKLSCILPARLWALHFRGCGNMKLSDGVFSFLKCLLVLDLSGCSLQNLPGFIGELKQLAYLSAPRIQDQAIPCITGLTRLMYLNLHLSSELLSLQLGNPQLLLNLDLSGCRSLEALPEIVIKHCFLEHLDLSGCSGLVKLPESLGWLQRLGHLDLSDCSGLVKLPESVGRLRALKHLDLSGCYFVKLPKSLGRLRSLEHLYLSGCSGLLELPGSLGKIRRLDRLDLSGCSGLVNLPEFGYMIYSLKHLDLSGCSRLVKLPESLGRLERLEHLDLSRCSELVKLPQWKLINLKHLDLSGCSCLGGIREALDVLTNLQNLNLSHHCGYSVDDWFHLKGIDEVLRNLKELRFLGLSSCLDPLCYALPPEESNSYTDCITGLVRLQHLDLSQNKFLQKLPNNIGNLKELRTLDLTGCFRLQSLSECIGELSQLCIIYVSGCPLLTPLLEQSGQRRHELLSSVTDNMEVMVSRPCQAGSHDEQSEQGSRPTTAAVHQARGSTIATQDASIEINQSSPAEPEITEITNEN